MPTKAKPADLLHQADTYEQATNALSRKIADGAIPPADRQALYTQSETLRSQTFKLRTAAGKGIVKELAVEVAQLQGAIDKAKVVLSTIGKVKSAIDVATSLAQLATAVSTGQPAEISVAYARLQIELAQLKPA